MRQLTCARLSVAVAVTALGVGAWIWKHDGSKPRRNAVGKDTTTNVDLRTQLEARRALALELEDAVIDELVAAGKYEEVLERGPENEREHFDPARFTGAVGVRVQRRPHPEGRLVRTIVVPEGYDATLDALVAEVGALELAIAEAER